MDLSISGLASGFDWKALVDQLVDVERAPQKRLKTDQEKLEQQKYAIGVLKSKLSALTSSVEKLKETSLFESRTVSTSDSSIATAKIAQGLSTGSYNLKVMQLATSASFQGLSNTGKAIGSTAVSLSSAGFASDITMGTFTINGHEITISNTSQSLQELFDNIKAATVDTGTGGYVEASYDSDADKITLTSKNADGSANNEPIALESETDTSNFLQAAKLFYNHSGSITSADSLGAVRINAGLDQANLATSIIGGSSGEFKINGVSINYDTSTDNISSIMTRINNSAAGVTASYDSVNDRFTLVNKATGDKGIALEDVNGNFLQATQLIGGSLQRGNNLLYTINDGGQLTSQSNTITSSSSGLEGLTVSVTKAGTVVDPEEVTITINADTEAVKTAIQNFISEYNGAQSLVDSLTANSTDAKGKVSAGLFATDWDVNQIASILRSKAYSEVQGVNTSLNSLSKIGIMTSGYNNSLTLEDSDLLDEYLQTKLNDLKDFFSNETNGLAVRLDTYLEQLTDDDDGSLAERQSTLAKQSTAIDTQIEDLERMVQANRQMLVNSFVSMESARSNINQQLQFLQKNLGV